MHRRWGLKIMGEIGRTKKDRKHLHRKTLGWGFHHITQWKGRGYNLYVERREKKREQSDRTHREGEYVNSTVECDRGGRGGKVDGEVGT
jgi:hypothetical protein